MKVLMYVYVDLNGVDLFELRGPQREQELQNEVTVAHRLKIPSQTHYLLCFKGSTQSR